MATSRISQDILRKFLVQHFLEGGLAGEVSLLWLPRGPVPTPLDSSFRGYVNNYAYMDKIRDLNRLEARIGEVAEEITRDMLQGIWQGVEYRLETNRTHVGT
jgi:hypothetical protein